MPPKKVGKPKAAAQSGKKSGPAKAAKGKAAAPKAAKGKAPPKSSLIAAPFGSRASTATLEPLPNKPPQDWTTLLQDAHLRHPKKHAFPNFQQDVKVYSIPPLPGSKDKRFFAECSFAGMRVMSSYQDPDARSSKADQPAELSFHSKASQAVSQLAKQVRFVALGKGWVKTTTDSDKRLSKREIGSFLRGIQGQAANDPAEHNFKAYPMSGDLRHSVTYLDDFQCYQSSSFRATLASMKGYPKIAATLAEIYRTEKARAGGERPEVSAMLQTVSDLAQDLVRDVEASPILRCSSLAEVENHITKAHGWVNARAMCSHWHLFLVLHSWLVCAADELWTARKLMPSEFPLAADALIGRALETALAMNARLSPAEIQSLEAARPVLRKDAATAPVLNLPSPIPVPAPTTPTVADAAAMNAVVTPDTYRPAHSAPPNAAAAAAGPSKTPPPLAGHLALNPDRPLGSFDEEKRVVRDQLEAKLLEIEERLAKDPDFNRPSALPRRWSVFHRDSHECYAIGFMHLVHLGNEALPASDGMLPEEQLKTAAAAGADARQVRLLLATKVLLQSFGPAHPVLSALPFLSHLKNVLRSSGDQDWVDYDGSTSQDILSVFMAVFTAIWDLLGTDGASKVGIRTTQYLRCHCSGLSLSAAIQANNVIKTEEEEATAMPIIPLFLSTNDFQPGPYPTVEQLLWAYLAEAEVTEENWPTTRACTCSKPSGTDFRVLRSCGRVIYVAVRRYTSHTGPLDRTEINLTAPVWLSDSEGNRHEYRVAGAALHHGPSLHDPGNHFSFAFLGKGFFALIDDKTSRLISEKELHDVVEKNAYILVLVRESITSAASLHGPRIPAAAGAYTFVATQTGRGQVVMDLNHPSASEQATSSSATVVALVDAPIHPPTNPSSHSSFQGLDVDADSVNRSSPVKMAIAKDAAESAAKRAASKTPAVKLEIGTSSIEAFQERYEWKSELGQGAFGAVSVRLDRATGQKVAVKISSMEGDLAKYAMREFGAMSVLNAGGGHAAVCPLIRGVVITGAGKTPKQNMALIMPLFVSDIAQLASQRSDQNRPLTAIEGRGAILAVAQALAFIHARGVMHRDLKPQNVMVTAVGGVVLGDFGAARRLAVAGEAEVTQIGSLNFQAPDVILHAAGLQPPYSAEVDVFGGGVLWFWLRQSQIVPFSPDKQREAVQAAQQTDKRDKAAEIQALVALAYSLRQIDPSVPCTLVPGGDWQFTFFEDDEDEDLPPQEQQAITQCLAFKAGDRPTAQQIVDSALFDPAAAAFLPHGSIKMPGVASKVVSALSSTASAVASAVSGAASAVVKALSPTPSAQLQLPAKRSFDQLPFGDSDSD